MDPNKRRMVAKSLRGSAIAKRRLAEIVDPGERIDLMLKNELGEEFLEELPLLIEKGYCSFMVHNSACRFFADDSVTEVQPGLHLWLMVRMENREFHINYDGLMLQFGNTRVAAKLTEQIVLQHFDTEPISWKVTDADIYAMRGHYSGSGTHALIEEAGFCAVLCTPQALDLALQMLPEARDLHGVQAEHKLQGVADYLRSLPGGDFSDIAILVQKVFSEAGNGSLYNLEKVVALAGMIQNDDPGLVREVLQSQREAILRLHFETPAQFVRSTNLRWLLKHGLIDEAEAMSTNGSVARLLTEFLSKGMLSAVLQFLHLVKVQHHHKSRMAARQAKELVALLLPDAFCLAMKEKRYGVAAAIGQFVVTSEISHDDRLRAVEMAIAHDQQMVLDWDYILDWDSGIQD